MTEEQIGVPGIYALFEGEELVYIGKDSHLPARILQHQAEGVKVFDDWKAFPIKGISDKELLKIEGELIWHYSPRYNAVGVCQSHRGKSRCKSKKGYVANIERWIEKMHCEDIDLECIGFTFCRECCAYQGNMDLIRDLISNPTRMAIENRCPVYGKQGLYGKEDGCTRGITLQDAKKYWRGMRWVNLKKFSDTTEKQYVQSTEGART